MAMQIKPILSALRKHRLAAMLISLQIALACAVLCNACFMISQRIAAMRIDSGVDEAALGTIGLDGVDPKQAVDLNARVTAGLRAIPGVQSVSLINSLPFGARRGTAGVTLDAPGHQGGQQYRGVVDYYVAGPGAFKALGLKVVAGRAPQPEDYQPANNFVPEHAPVLVTRALARHLWPNANPLGKRFWTDKFVFRVIGVIDHLVIPAPGSRGLASDQWSVFVPALPGGTLAGTYLIRAAPEDLPRVMRDARAAITKIAPDAVLDHDNSQTISDLRHTFFKSDRVMAGLLLGVIAALLGVTALGIVGLASFWVAQRRKQIGVRRALGATRGDILRYFQTENFLIATFGIALGMVLAFGLNLVLMQHYELPRLPFVYLPVGALVLWALGQLAVLAPALRAAAVPPVVATRSV
jgi:putative ABC transport system permease protein